MHQALDLNYLETQPSKMLLNPKEEMASPEGIRKYILHSCSDIDLGELYQGVTFKQR